MEQRYLQIVVTLSVSLLALFYVAHNLANWNEALEAIGYVLSQQDHAVYPNNLAPAITNSGVVSAVLIAICAGEMAAGLFALVGGYRLWSARKSETACFTAAKRFAIIGVGLAVTVWFLLFAVIGGALYQMWQTQVGAGSLAGAFQYAGLSFFALIHLSLPEPEIEISATK